MNRVAEAIVQAKTRVIDIDLKAYFDTVRHRPAARQGGRSGSATTRCCTCCKLMLKASGKQGVPQGGVISPLLSNLYLNEVDRMLERAKSVTRYGQVHRPSSTRALPMIW